MEVFKGTILSKAGFVAEKNWILVELEKSLIYNDEEISHCFIKCKNNTTVKPNAKNQIIYFRIVKKGQYIKNDQNQFDDFPFIGWFYCW